MPSVCPPCLCAGSLTAEQFPISHWSHSVNVLEDVQLTRTVGKTARSDRASQFTVGGDRKLTRKRCNLLPVVQLSDVGCSVDIASILGGGRLKRRARRFYAAGNQSQSFFPALICAVLTHHTAMGGNAYVPSSSSSHARSLSFSRFPWSGPTQQSGRYLSSFHPRGYPPEMVIVAFLTPPVDASHPSCSPRNAVRSAGCVRGPTRLRVPSFARTHRPLAFLMQPRRSLHTSCAAVQGTALAGRPSGRLGARSPPIGYSAAC